MHIPDGYLGPATCIAGYAAMAPVWGIAARRVRKNLQDRQVPLLAVGAAFSFVIMMFNVPVPGGSTGHAVGAVLVAILLGPWAAVIAVSVALVIQALLFGDGGITALGANCFNMAFVMPFVGYACYRTIGAGSSVKSMRRVVAAGIAGFTGLLAAALCAGIEFGLQPLLHHTDSGQALYCPYGLRVAVGTMAAEHLLFFGWVELAVTALVVKYLQQREPGLLVHGHMKTTTKLWIGVAVLAVLSPIGIIVPEILHAGSAWGEWGGEEIKGLVGFVPEGFARLSGLWNALIPDYSLGWHPNLVYAGSAIAGAALCVVLVIFIGRFLSRRDRDAGPAHKARRTSVFIERTIQAAVALLMQAVSNDEVASRNGFLQRRDPRVKILCVAGLLTGVLLTRSLVVLAAAYLICLVLAALSRIAPGQFLMRTGLFVPVFSLFIAAPALFGWVTPGDPVAAWTFAGIDFTITRQGIDSAVLFVMRVLASVSLAVLLVLTTRHHVLLKVLRVFRIPRIFVMTLGMTYRYIYLLLDTMQNSMSAIKSRVGGVASTRAGRRVVAANMAGLWLRSYRTQSEVYTAMISRGYGGEPRVLDGFRINVTDVVFAAFTIAVLAGTLWLNHSIR